jgi:hypothetical protein
LRSRAISRDGHASNASPATAPTARKVRVPLTGTEARIRVKIDIYS